MKGRRKFESLRREVETKSPKIKIIIYCEGEKTEPDYFKALKRSFPHTLIDIEVMPAVGVPHTIAEKAINAAKNAGKSKALANEKNEFWAVFDRDEHPNFEDSINRCEAAGVNVAYSIPCFELWFILHYEDYNKPNDHEAVQRHFEILCPDYDRNKRKTTDCAKLIQSIETAERRAEKQFTDNYREGERFRSPVTTVYQLTRRIRGL